MRSVISDFLSESRLVRLLAWTVLVMLALLPFHAFLTVWGASILGHYTMLRLWKEFLLLLLAPGALYLLWRDEVLFQRLLDWRLTWLLSMYVGVQLLWGVVAYHLHTVSLKALAYGWLIDLRFIVFFLVVWVVASKTALLRERWRAFVLWPLLAVCVVGFLQYFLLPYDFLKHFGYSDKTIFPYETINHNTNYPRVMATLRGANPLGAYLVLTVSLTTALWQRFRVWWLAALAALGGLVMVLTFSRSAWIGLAAALLILLLVGLRRRRTKQIVLITGVAVVILVLIGALALRHNASFQNAFLHTQDHSAVARSSNAGHASALKDGVCDLLHQPFGNGPGSAGPASAYNNHPARIAENFYVQIGQETGWIGLILFVMLNVSVARLLWARRSDPLALGLFAALVGLSIVNLLSHAWADDTLAYMFWGLAGLALADTVGKPKSNRKTAQESRWLL